ncbi:MAG TPA: nuclear transport factor 2 family protein [Chthonomonadales bacterium]|nr:nuclear transport factor 2 family protein [Chthonomonadales bacterium]
MRVILLFAALLATAPTAPKPPSHSSDVKAITALHARLMSAFKSHNANAIKALFTSDFTQTANGMTFNRDQAAAQMAQGSAAGEASWTMKALKVHGARADYLSAFKFITRSPGTAGAAGAASKGHTISGSGVQRVDLVKQRGTWLYHHLQVLSIKIMMDGKPFNVPSQPAAMKKPAR